MGVMWGFPRGVRTGTLKQFRVSCLGIAKIPTILGVGFWAWVQVSGNILRLINITRACIRQVRGLCQATDLFLCETLALSLSHL